MVSDGQIPDDGNVGAAGQGVANNAGAAGGAGVAGDQAGTAQQGKRPEQTVSLEDFKRFQASMSRQTDNLRKQLDAERQQAGQVFQGLQEQINQKEDEMLRLKTDGLPTEQVEYEKIKLERDRLARQHQMLTNQFTQVNQTLNQVVDQSRNQQAREVVIKMFLDGVPGRIANYSQYGLTRQDLDGCQSPEEMQDVAVAKAHSWLEAQKAELEKQRATAVAKEKKTTGQTKFDQGEPNVGAKTMPKAGTPEFRQYYNDVRTGKIKLH